MIERLPLDYQQRLRELYYCFPRHFQSECPLCGSRFRHFLPGGVSADVLIEKRVIGGGYRSNMLCPHCDSTDRERLVFLYLRLRTLIFFQTVRLLHLAPERQLQRALREHTNIDYLSGDLNSPLAMVRMDLTKPELESNSFDVIICNHVLEHIPEDRKAMSQLFRILKPGGWAILQVPLSLSLKETIEDPSINDPKERLKLFGQEDHVRIYAADDYKRRLECAGFVVSLWSAAGKYGMRFIRRYSLIKEEQLYVCAKPIDTIEDQRFKERKGV